MNHRVRMALLGIVVAAAVWFFAARAPRISARGVSENPARQTAACGVHATSSHSEIEPADDSLQTVGPVASDPVIATPRPASLAAMREPPEGPETESGVTPVTVMENMRAVFRQYAAQFGGNPVGINREITAALNGGNSRQMIFINPEDGLRINEKGQLVDNWGTPFFFHQLSSVEMEIHSAGPDRKMWTADDLVIK